MDAVSRMALDHGCVRRVAAIMLRDTVAEFNAAPVSLSSVETFRERVLKCADMLQIPVAETQLGDAMLRSIR